MPTSDFRRKLSPRETAPAIGIAAAAGVGVGLAAFYVTRLLLQRTPLRSPAGELSRGVPAVPIMEPPPPPAAPRP